MRFDSELIMKSLKIVIAATLVIMLSTSISLAQIVEEGWYPGKGLQEGLLVKYRVQGFEITNDKPITLTLWFKNQTENGNWNVYMIMEEEGKVIDGWTQMSPKNLRPQGFVDDPELDRARQIFKDSIDWVAGYTSADEPKSLSVGSTWGSIAAIGGGGITLTISEQTQVTAAGKTWDVSVLKWFHKRDLPSELWINDNFPLPIHGFSYAQSSQEPIPIQFQFDLLAYSITDEQPIPPKEEIEIPKPPLSQLTRSGGFLFELRWAPELIEPGKPVKMAPIIRNAQGKLLNNAIYNFIIVDEEGNEIYKVENEIAEGGIGKTQEITFEKGGNYKVIVECTSCKFGTIAPTPTETQFVEQAEFNIIVVPEFPIGAIIAMASIVAVVIAVSRFKQINIPKI
ncbi:MAG: hypothetical protein D6752_06590 [Candidatus Nitrosothermus koennekii]|nr:MAG: hypothetical protein D6752_06590 [Candidatus Nitrosothermus koennekii]